MPIQQILLTATVSAEQGDLFAALCWELGTEGLQEDDAERPGCLCFRAYFRPAASVESLKDQFSKAAAVAGLTYAHLQVELTESSPEEWLRACRDRFGGFDIGSTFHVHPVWEPPSRRHEVNILMEPGRAFGTGTHESTQLCLLALPEILPDTGSFLDIGTGSGILSIAACKLRPAAAVYSIDNDPAAVEMACFNMSRNRVPFHRLAAAEPSAIRGGFEVIFANLTPEIFRQTAVEIVRLAAGPILLSGFTAEQTDRVLEHFRGAGNVAARQLWTLNDWSCMLLRAG